MNLEFTIDHNDFRRSIEEVTSELVKDFVEQAPESFAAILDNPPPSSKGSAPAARTKTLMRTIKVIVVAPTEADLDFIYYAQYLDPIFEEKNHDRPFVNQGIARTLADQ